MQKAMMMMIMMMMMMNDDIHDDDHHHTGACFYPLHYATIHSSKVFPDLSLKCAHLPIHTTPKCHKLSKQMPLSYSRQ